MKRKGDIFSEIIHPKKLIIADRKARKGKKNTIDVKKFDTSYGCNIISLFNELDTGSYKTSNYINFTIFEPKERKISKLPYRDRIVHHALINPLKKTFVDSFISQTYSCIEGRGIHKCLSDFNEKLKYNTFCLKIDIEKFYPSVKNNILKNQLCRKFKDKRLLKIFFNIIDSFEGLPLGNYTSQYFGNFYLNCFDHWLKEDKKVKYYFRYCDDSIILHNDKDYLHKLLKEISEYLKVNLGLKLSRWRIFPIKTGIDFLGYVSFGTHILIRKSIKESFKNMLSKYPNHNSIKSYWGWLKHCNSINLLNILKTRYEKEFSY